MPNSAPNSTPKPSLAPNQILQIDEFVRSIQVRKSEPHALFLGAGASISSGVPSAGACIWDWKRRIFLSNNPGLENHVREISLGSVKKRIQTWLDAQRRWPREGTDEEYGIYIQACFPASASDRRNYFQALCRDAQPHSGYQFLSLLAQSGVIKTVWTTNFDGLTLQAVRAKGLSVVECSLDTAERAVRPPHIRELIHIALHGDYRYDELKNTADELQNQDAIFREDLIQRLYDNHLIVCGYSGRDHSVMEALRKAYKQSGPAGEAAPGRLFWCGTSDAPTDDSDPVFQLLALAKQHKREAFYVKIDSFDDVLRRLSLACLEGELSKEAQALNESAPEKIVATPFVLEKGEGLEILRSNAFPIELPTSLWEFAPKNLEVGRRNHLRQLTGASDVIAAPFKQQVFALGELSEIQKVFASHIGGDIYPGNITDDDLNRMKGIIVEMLTSAVTRSLAQQHNFCSNRKNLIWQKGFETKRVSNQTCRVHKAVFLALRHYADRQYLVLEPTVVGHNERNDRLEKEVEQELKRQILGYQRNQKYVSDVNFWRKKLFGEGNEFSFSFPLNSSQGSIFRVQTRPTLSIVHHPPQKPNEEPQSDFAIKPQLRALIKSDGVRIEEPKLTFVAKSGNGYCYDAYPLRGIFRNRPYDYALTQQQPGTTIRIGAVAPQDETNNGYRNAAGRFLTQLDGVSIAGANQEYVLDYPGFAKAFGLPLSLPRPDGAGWSFYEIPPNGGNLLSEATKMQASIVAAVDRLIESGEVDVVVVYVPDCCEDLTDIPFEGGRFNLRRLIKAYCIERGVASQFLKDKTVYGPDNMRCQTLWWLALALYVKAGRTPYILAGLDAEATFDDTAFAGLGFSQDQGSAKGKHITIGCSHIYSARGVDLKYKLSGLDNVLWQQDNSFLKQDNPFLTRSDARRIGEGVRELFFEATGKLPRRVVLHKRTPFGDDETKGLIEGLSGVEEIDLLEVTFEPHLRFMTQIEDQGKLRGDNYPVSRDTVLQLGSHRALLWVHGTVPSVRPGKNYYMGGFRIPAPLMVHRAYGSTPLNVLAHEILGLSKMNWNTFGMYTKAPATIESSNDIARIGALLNRFGSVSYDYRLFI